MSEHEPEQQPQTAMSYPVPFWPTYQHLGMLPGQAVDLRLKDLLPDVIRPADFLQPFVLRDEPWHVPTMIQTNPTREQD